MAPENNKKYLEDIPANVTADLEFHFVKHMDEVLKIALVRPPTSQNHKRVPSHPQPALA